MALVVKNKMKGCSVSMAALIMVVITLLLSASSIGTRRRIRRCYRIKDGIKVYQDCSKRSRYTTYLVHLRKPPNADTMDDDAWRRWYESFVPSSAIEDDTWRRWLESVAPNSLTDYDDDEPRYFNCYTGYDYGILFVGLTGFEPMEMAKKPGVVSMSSMGPWVIPENTPCSRNASIVDKNRLRVEYENS